MQKLIFLANFCPKANKCIKQFYATALRNLFHFSKATNSNALVSSILDDIDLMLKTRYELTLTSKHKKRQ